LYEEPVVTSEPDVEASKTLKKKVEPVVEAEPEVESPVTEEPLADGDS
jgi:hypothetical protein